PRRLPPRSPRRPRRNNTAQGARRCGGRAHCLSLAISTFFNARGRTVPSGNVCPSDVASLGARPALLPLGREPLLFGRFLLGRAEGALQLLDKPVHIDTGGHAALRLELEIRR